MRKIVLLVMAVIMMFSLASCGKKLELPQGYPTAVFPICDSVGVIYSATSGLENTPIYNVNYESKLSVEDVLASYLLTIPDSEIFDTETGYMLAGQQDSYMYTIYIDEVKNAQNAGAKTVVQTMISVIG